MRSIHVSSRYLVVVVNRNAKYLGVPDSKVLSRGKSGGGRRRMLLDGYRVDDRGEMRVASKSEGEKAVSCLLFVNQPLLSR